MQTTISPGLACCPSSRTLHLRTPTTAACVRSPIPRQPLRRFSSGAPLPGSGHSDREPFQSGGVRIEGVPDASAARSGPARSRPSEENLDGDADNINLRHFPRLPRGSRSFPQGSDRQPSAPQIIQPNSAAASLPPRRRPRRYRASPCACLRSCTDHLCAFDAPSLRLMIRAPWPQGDVGHVEVGEPAEHRGIALVLQLFSCIRGTPAPWRRCSQSVGHGKGRKGRPEARPRPRAHRRPSRSRSPDRRRLIYAGRPGLPRLCA
jgi:hypothetical protein